MPRRKSSLPFWELVAETSSEDIPLQYAVEYVVREAVGRALKAGKLVEPHDWPKPTEEELKETYRKHHPRA